MLIYYPEVKVSLLMSDVISFIRGRNLVEDLTIQEVVDRFSIFFVLDINVGYGHTNKRVHRSIYALGTFSAVRFLLIALKGSEPRHCPEIVYSLCYIS